MSDVRLKMPGKKRTVFERHLRQVENANFLSESGCDQSRESLGMMALTGLSTLHKHTAC
jgi:hypothetical protein